MAEEPTERKIARFMAASTPIENLLREGRPLTEVQLQSLTVTVAQLQTYIDIWNRKNQIAPSHFPPYTGS